MDIPVKPKKLPALDSDFATSIAKAIWRNAAQMIEYLNASYPIGMLMYFEGNKDGLLAQPDPNYWKFCDGTIISNVNSILDGQTSPNLNDYIMIRHPDTGETVYTTGGANSVDLSHAHGGSTGYTNPGASAACAPGAQFAAGTLHNHLIQVSSLTYYTIPLAYRVQVYMRIA